MKNHDRRLDDHPDADDHYIACWDSVMYYICRTCCADAGERCITTSGRELSITHTHKPRVDKARNANNQPVPVAPGYFDGMDS